VWGCCQLGLSRGDIVRNVLKHLREEWSQMNATSGGDCDVVGESDGMVASASVVITSANEDMVT